jgi:metal-responsive CopG/Arc/MetJ family transcriptional regulator
MTRKLGTRATVLVTVSMTPAYLKRLDQLAWGEHISRSECVRKLIGESGTASKLEDTHSGRWGR